MPAFLVPLHEYNHCHNPDGAAGGQFCSEPGAGSVSAKKAKGKIVTLDKPLTPEDERQVIGTAGAAEHLAHAMVEALPEEFVVRVAATSKGVLVRLVSPKVNVTRLLQRDHEGKLVAVHSNFELKSDLQAGGIAKDLMVAQLAEYERMGVDKIELSANLDVGGYAWARYGFKAKRPGDLAGELLKTLGGENKHAWMRPPTAAPVLTLSPEHREVLRALVTKHQNDPKLPWIIADAHYSGVKIGKELLLKTHWEGFMDLHDAEAVGRMTRYLHRAKDTRH